MAPKAAMIVADVLPEPTGLGHPTTVGHSLAVLRCTIGTGPCPVHSPPFVLNSSLKLLSYGEKLALDESLLFPFMVCVTLWAYLFLVLSLMDS